MEFSRVLPPEILFPDVMESYDDGDVNFIAHHKF